MKLSDKEILDIYYAVPATQRRNSYWVMSEETLRMQVGHSSGRIGDDTRYLCGKPIKIDSEAVGIKLVPECICDLVDVSNAWDPTHFAYVRGKSNGCMVHGTDDERREIAEREAWAEELRRREQAAMRTARECP